MIRGARTIASLQDSESAFLRELPDLLREHEGKWAAYHGADRITMSSTKWEAYSECYRQGLTDDEFLVRCIEPPFDEIIVGPDSQSQ